MNEPTRIDEFYDVVDFKIVGHYTVCVSFDDGSERVIDFEPILLGPLFGPLRELDLFNQVTIDPDIGTLVWPTGADIDPNVLYIWPHHVDSIIERRRQKFAVLI